jgi:hypothetical protein
VADSVSGVGAVTLRRLLDGLPALPGVEHRWMDVRSSSGPVRLHLAHAGSGPPVLLLHGWLQHWWCWRRVIDQLSGHYRLLAPTCGLDGVRHLAAATAQPPSPAMRWRCWMPSTWPAPV